MTRLFAALLGATYLWVALMPLVPAISVAGMRRFNLIGDSFPVWALQQPVPSMYNFANMGTLISGEMEAAAPPVAANHFPTRRYTFLQRSALRPSLPQVLLTSSSYRGNKVAARHVIIPGPDGGAVMIRDERK